MIKSCTLYPQSKKSWRGSITSCCSRHTDAWSCSFSDCTFHWTFMSRTRILRANTTGLQWCFNWPVASLLHTTTCLSSKYTIYEITYLTFDNKRSLTSEITKAFQLCVVLSNISRQRWSRYSGNDFCSTLQLKNITQDCVDKLDWRFISYLYVGRGWEKQISRHVVINTRRPRLDGHNQLFPLSFFQQPIRIVAQGVKNITGNARFSVGFYCVSWSLSCPAWV